MRNNYFRVWDKLNKVFLTSSESILISDCGYVYMLDGYEVHPLDNGNISISYDTGLKDKNGVEIYEGDIDKNGRVVIWSKQGTRFAFKEYRENPYGKMSPRLYSIKNCEIIGNIYENPELLEDK